MAKAKKVAKTSKGKSKFINALKKTEGNMEKTAKKTKKEFALEKLISKVSGKKYVGNR